MEEMIEAPTKTNSAIKLVSRIVMVAVFLLLGTAALRQINLLKLPPKKLDAEKRFSGGSNLVSAAQSLEAYEQNAWQVVGSWEIPSEYDDVARHLVREDLGYKSLIALRNQSDQLQEAYKISSVRSAEFLQGILDDFLNSVREGPQGDSPGNQVSPTSESIQLIRQVSERLRMRDAQGRLSDRVGSLSTIHGELQQALQKLIAIDTQSSDGLGVRIGDHRAKKPKSSLAFTDRVGKEYASKQERDAAIRDEVLSGRFDSSDGKRNSAIYQSYIRENLSRAWSQDEQTRQKLALEQKAFDATLDKLLKELEFVATRLQACEDLHEQLEQAQEQQEQSEELYYNLKRTTETSLAVAAREAQRTVRASIESVNLPGLPMDPTEIGIEMPTQSHIPNKPEPRGTLIVGKTHRIEGINYFINNQVIEIPESVKQYYVRNIGPFSPNVVLITGMFEFQGNEATVLVQLKPVEKYRVPEMMLKYYRDLPQIESMREQHHKKAAIYNEVKDKLDSLTGRAYAFKSILEEDVGSSVELVIDYLERVQQAAADLSGTQKNPPLLAESDLARINDFLKPLSDFKFLRIQHAYLDTAAAASDIKIEPAAPQTPEKESRELPGRGGEVVRSLELLNSEDVAAVKVQQDADGRIELVSFYGCRLTEKKLGALNSLPDLTNVNFANAEFPKSQLGSLGTLDSVTHFAAWGSNLSPSGFTALCDKLPNLRYLGMNVTKAVDDSSVKSILKLVHLRRFNIGWSGITHGQLEEIAKLPSLTHLSLEGTNYGDKALASLSECKQLEVVVFSKANVDFSKNALDRFRSSLPNCRLQLN